MDSIIVHIIVSMYQHSSEGNFILSFHVKGYPQIFLMKKINSKINLHRSKPFYGLKEKPANERGTRHAREQLTPGGFEDISYVTRFTPVTSLVIREDIRRSTSGGNTYLIHAGEL